VVVTATKRADNIQDVPISVLAVTGETLERQNIRDFDDLVKVVPSLTITKTSQPANNSINIRGIGTYAYSIATEPSVAVVIDDVPQAFQAEAFAALADVQQVEVLRGPQSTLFGKSASAGVVNITTLPVSDVWTGRAGVLFTGDDEQRYEATLSGPIADNLRIRLSGNYSHYRGNIFNLGTNDWLNGASDATLRGKLDLTPSDDWDVTLSPYYTHQLASCCAGAEYFVSPGVTFSKAGIPQSAILQGITPGPNNTLTRMDVDAKGNSVDFGTGLRIRHDLGGGFTFLSITSYDRYFLHDLQDTDSSAFDFSTLVPQAPPGGSANGGAFKIDSVTQELRLTSPEDDRFRYVGGFFFSRTGSERFFVRGSNDLGTYNGLTSLPSTNSTAYSGYVAHAAASNYALFAEGTYGLTEALDFIGGLRVNYEAISYNFFDFGNNVTYGAPDCSTKSSTVTVHTCDDDVALTGRAGFQYHITPDVMAFATYTRGYKGMAYDLTSTLTSRSPVASGPLTGLPTADAVASKQPIPAETVNAYEIGIRNSFWDRRLIWNLTLFDEEFANFQAQSRDLLTGQNVLNSIGQVHSRGIESEVSALIDPQFSTNFAVTYNLATLDSFPNAACFGGQTTTQGCVDGQQDLSGKPLFNAPRWNFVLSGNYDIPISTDLTLSVGASYHWQSKVIYSLLQDPDSLQGAYGVADLSMSLDGDWWRVTGFVNNLFDERYALTIGRDAQWNINPGGTPATDALTWKPARDSFRYFGVRASVTY
jgi:iron complex outermembrane receptor protein